MFHKAAFLGQPGSGKSTMGLSYPGVEQHVWGSSEEDTALNFSGRKDILPPVKLDWFECLTDDEKKKFSDASISEEVVVGLSKVARAKNVAKYRRYLYQLKTKLTPGLETIFLDNGTPFLQDFQDYVEVVFGKEFITEGGNFNSIKFSIKYQSEVMDFMRLFFSLPCHCLASFHISMTVDEEVSARVNFLEDTKKGIKHPKEWQPMIYGKAKYAIAGIPTWAFFLWCEESPGKPNEYYAKLEADSSNVGLAKSRIQPFKEPSKIKVPKNDFYNFFNTALLEKVKA
mgnify:CR=1 FL=1